MREEWCEAPFVRCGDFSTSFVHQRWTHSGRNDRVRGVCGGVGCVRKAVGWAPGGVGFCVGGVAPLFDLVWYSVGGVGCA